MFGVKRNLDHPQRAKLVAYLAEQQCVTVEHFLDVVAKRKAFRRAKMYRNRSRARVVEKNSLANRNAANREQLVYSGEGPLHTLMRMMNLTTAEFCEIADIHHAVYYKWYGHPLHGWPVRFLDLLYRVRAMEAYLRDQGVAPERFKPVLPVDLHKNGRYPRKKGQLDVSSAPLNLEWSPWKGAL